MLLYLSTLFYPDNTGTTAVQKILIPNQTVDPEWEQFSYFTYSQSRELTELKGRCEEETLNFFLDRITLEVRITCKWVLSCCHWALLIQWYSDVGRTTTETFLAYQVYYVLPLRHVSIESIVTVPASQISDSLG